MDDEEEVGAAEPVKRIRLIRYEIRPRYGDVLTVSDRPTARGAGYRATPCHFLDVVRIGHRGGSTWSEGDKGRRRRRAETFEDDFKAATSASATAAAGYHPRRLSHPPPRARKKEREQSALRYRKIDLIKRRLTVAPVSPETFRRTSPEFPTRSRVIGDIGRRSTCFISTLASCLTLNAASQHSRAPRELPAASLSLPPSS